MDEEGRIVEPDGEAEMRDPGDAPHVFVHGDGGIDGKRSRRESLPMHFRELSRIRCAADSRNETLGVRCGDFVWVLGSRVVAGVGFFGGPQAVSAGGVGRAVLGGSAAERHGTGSCADAGAPEGGAEGRGADAGGAL